MAVAEDERARERVVGADDAEADEEEEERRARLEARVVVVAAAATAVEDEGEGADEDASARFRLRVSIQKPKPPSFGFHHLTTDKSFAYPIAIRTIKINPTNRIGDRFDFSAEFGT